MERLAADVRAELVARSGTPLRHGDLLRLGLEQHDVQRLLRKRALQRFHSRYVGGHVDPRQTRIACTQAAHPGTVVSHFSAAELRGLRVWGTGTSGPVWLTRPPGTQRNLRNADVVLRRAGLPASELQHHRGLVLTSDARTTVDLARELPLREAVVTVDDTLARAVSRAELEAVMEGQERWPSIRAARAAVALGDPRSESALESFARVVFLEAGLPVPVLQAQFWDGYRWMVERVDFWSPEFRTVAEADGLQKFEAPTAQERRRLLRRSYERDQRLTDHGLELIHFGWEDAVRRPQQLVRRLRSAFHRGIQRAGDPPGWRVAPVLQPTLCTA
ncbi:hypothetical protein E1218_28640 [Kribbella turkmenica]|uniref:Transcriptional regulator, AbiEi antitoxin, Type IV TA system n=1 Tax=Kribbella turkmenica TaxID=2530375 RepID=A0A4R4WKS1_9ACTN|nr:hypothetical protein [Kribbella turkmenica]TDD17033.1 hypothetical protein E1218_28640 [Kribbella turkmenica]